MNTYHIKVNTIFEENFFDFHIMAANEEDALNKATNEARNMIEMMLATFRVGIIDENKQEETT